jgi:hypothetical protein
MDPANDMSSSDLGFYLQHDYDNEQKRSHKFMLDDVNSVSSEKFEASQEHTKYFED